MKKVTGVNMMRVYDKKINTEQIFSFQHTFIFRYSSCPAMDKLQ